MMFIVWYFIFLNIIVLLTILFLYIDHLLQKKYNLNNKEKNDLEKIVYEIWSSFVVDSKNEKKDLLLMITFVISGFFLILITILVVHYLLRGFKYFYLTWLLKKHKRNKI